MAYPSAIRWSRCRDSTRQAADTRRARGWAFFVPDCVIALLANRLCIHFRGSPWRLAAQRGMAPVAIVLMTSGVTPASTASVMPNLNPSILRVY